MKYSSYTKDQLVEELKKADKIISDQAKDLQRHKAIRDDYLKQKQELKEEVNVLKKRLSSLKGSNQLEIKNLKVQFIDHLFEYKTLKENELPF